MVSAGVTGPRCCSGAAQCPVTHTCQTLVASKQGRKQTFAARLHPHLDFFRQASGLAAILAACITSGFAGVFFEKVLKRKER